MIGLYSPPNDVRRLADGHSAISTDGLGCPSR
jgi:hypothetical protein